MSKIQHAKNHGQFLVSLNLKCTNAGKVGVAESADSVGVFLKFKLDQKPIHYTWEYVEPTTPGTRVVDTALPSEKLSNPKDALGCKKRTLTSLSMPVLYEMGAGMLEGGCKYGLHNYRSIGVRAKVYIDAAMRHLTAFWEGEDVDPDSGLSHITKAMTSLHVLRDCQIMGNWVDDRPVRPPDDWVADAQLDVDRVLDRHPNPVKPFLNKPDQL